MFYYKTYLEPIVLICRVLYGAAWKTALDRLASKLSHLVIIIYGVKKQDSVYTVREHNQILTVKELHLKESLNLLIIFYKKESPLKQFNSKTTRYQNWEVLVNPSHPLITQLAVFLNLVA